jgi:hypothetical protein
MQSDVIELDFSKARLSRITAKRLDAKDLDEVVFVVRWPAQLQGPYEAAIIQREYGKLEYVIANSKQTGVISTPKQKADLLALLEDYRHQVIPPFKAVDSIAKYPLKARDLLIARLRAEVQAELASP